MCGIAGRFGAGLSEDRLRALGQAMAGAIAHRGPDDEGVQVDPRCGVMAHRRLSIIDLSANGHQPMVSHDGRWTMVFNGECYNYLELRRDLEARFGRIAWRSESDAEVVLEAAARVGVAETLRMMNGMFALAFLDTTGRELFLARDRIGKKPLDVHRAGQRVLFASELGSLMAVPDFE
ncbi:MAG: asparagine synthetase B, partial [Pseudomonadota bacterium]